MSFLYLIGLLGLIAVPVFILIYIIKNKYTEQTIPSTYLWTLSEKFIKKRLPISRLVGIIALILQILVAVLASFLIAHPVITLADSANAYCFVLDASGSMNIEQDGKTRFARAVDWIEGQIDGAANGSLYTLVYIGASSERIYTELTDKDQAIEILHSLEVSCITPEYIKMLDAAQDYFNENAASVIYLVTDKNYQQTQNIEVVNVTAGKDAVENYALSGIEYEATGTQIVVSGKAISYTSDANVEVEVSFAASGTEDYVPSASQTLSLIKEEETAFTISCDVASFGAMKVRIKDADALALDSEVIVYSVDAQNFGNALIITELPEAGTNGQPAFFLRAAMRAAGFKDAGDEEAGASGIMSVMSPEEYLETTPSGYGLYIFDSCTPEVMPESGAVWFINPTKTVPGANFTFQDTATPRQEATYSTSTSTTVKRLLAGTSGRSFALSGYVKCGVSGKFTTLVTCDRNSVVFTGSNVYGNREVVFAFPLNASAPFALTGDLAALVSNFLNYSFPTLIEETNYYCGEVAQVNVLPGCLSIEVETPGGKKAYLDTTVAVSEYRLDEAGAYKISMTMRGGTDVRTLNVFASLPESERVPAEEGEDFIIEGLALDGKFDGIYDDLLILFILLGVVAVADYGVYCYEQYQLR